MSIPHNIRILLYNLFPATALVGTSDEDIHALFHAHSEEAKQVFRFIDEMAKQHKVVSKFSFLLSNFQEIYHGLDIYGCLNALVCL